ncbi:NAD-dependent epimerase [Bacteriovoracaceae bacterium]|nr:NAD-dependent epimerase [Bacteriovoracaceae bacterium]
MNILVTGAAGFIGMHVAIKFLKSGDKVYGVDNLSDYYDVSLKEARLNELEKYDNFKFSKIDISHNSDIEELFKTNTFDMVISLAAQPGVRYSLKNPHVYVQSNIVGFINILECCRHHKVKHLVYASSSSVYGNNKKMPFQVTDNVDHPISIYAATKKSNELMAYTYASLYGLPCTGLRFFTVYGPWGRPDMAPFLFTDAILNKKKIKVFNHGDLLRDFTYVDDIVEGVYRVSQKVPETKVLEDQSEVPPYILHNIGNNNPIKLLDFIETIETRLGQKAEKEMLPMQEGDVYSTFADTKSLQDEVGFNPSTELKEGIDRFISWYLKFYEK